MRARAAGVSNVLIPKIPYIPPPSDPRQMAAWYTRYHAAMEDWREKVNQAMTGAKATLQTP